jgi:RNA polymerase sigma factor (sigma-70 family)
VETKATSAHDLLVRLKHGNVEAIDMLYPRYARAFYGYAKRKQLSHEEAEDIVGATFDRILTCIQSYNEVKCGGEKWMWIICRNLVTDVLRNKCKQTGEDFDIHHLSENADPEWILEQREYNRAISRAWNKISEEDRQEILKGRGRGPGRKAWWEAIQRFFAALSEELSEE